MSDRSRKALVAVCNDWVEEVRELVAKGIDVNRRLGPYLNTLLQWGIMRNGSVEVCKILVEAGT